MSELRLYNTLTRRKERFAPIEPPRVRIYSCGPTVYLHQHLGNMRPYVFADLLKRVLERFGYEVYHVVNITDVGHLTDDADAGEDRMELSAQRQGVSVQDVAERYTRMFKADLARLQVRDPDVWCKASAHVAEQIEMIKALESRGFSYRTGDGIYFDTSLDPHYGELRPRDVAAQETQERIAGARDKRHAADFALWKFSPREGARRQMEWSSPWGVGFPGWHIECSAMSSRYLGKTFDIHTGGIDHVPVHHTNEIVQSENALGVRPWVRWWMHNGWLMFGGGKMSKSKGGTLTLDDLVERGVEPLAFRYFLLASVYRQEVHFSDDALEGARSAYRRLVRHAEELRETGPAEDGDALAALAPYRERFDAALADDLNSPRALAVVWEAVRDAGLAARARWTLLADFDSVLGLGLATARLDAGAVDERIDALVRERDRARAERDFARADAIREQLAAEGIALEDSPQGTRWRRV